MTSPDRRSTADLQKILEGLIGGQGSIRCAELPDVLLKYEVENDAVILESSEYDGLRALCEQSPDIELDAQDVFAFLSIIPKVETKPAMPHSASMPTFAMQASQMTPPTVHKPNRRHSDRVRSPSDSSSSDSDDQTRVRQISNSKAFPLGSAREGSNIPRPVAQRVKKLSDPARLDSPLAVRRRANQQPPSSYSPFGAFSRPSPANRRRRGSAESNPGPDTAGESDPRPPSQTRVRKISQPSMRSSSPLWSGSQASDPSSPLFPTFNINGQHRSFSGDAQLDSAEVDDLEEADMSLELQHTGNSDPSEELDQIGEDMLGGHDSLNPRLSRISTESSASLRTSHDKLQILQKQNADLARKLKEGERQLAIIGSENERLVEDLQERLDEAKAEIASKRKDEKDLKSKDRAQTIQIAGFEADISSLQRSLEAAKANHANMSKMYNSQCDEAQRLRDLLRDRDEETERLEDASSMHEGEESKYTREVEVLESEVKRLEQDLRVARQAESHLEAQKQENLQLKETIDRMRFDLEEARSQNAAHGHSRGATSSGAGTMSRNLGAEISRRLFEAEDRGAVKEEDAPGEASEDDYVETVVTTHRTRKAGVKASKPDADADTTPARQSGLREIVRDYADVATATEPEEPTSGPSTIPGSPPAYTAEAEPINEQQVLDKAHPRGVVEGLHEGYDGVVQITGTRCTVLESELKSRRQQAAARRGATTSSQSDKIIGYVFLSQDVLWKYGTYVVAAFAVGVLFGSSLLHFPSRDVALFHRMNTLAVASGAGEGFLPFGQRGVVGFMENGAKLVSGRVPI